MANRIQLRRDTAANWLSVNPVLADGEPGFEYDTGKIKYGDGITNWFSLAYAGGADVTYGNVQVAEYLTHFDGTINFTSSPAIISGVGTISTANLSVYTTATINNINNTSSQVGTQITGIEGWDGAGADNGYVWIGNQPNFMRLFNLGSSTIGWSFYSADNPGSVVTITDNAPPLGGPGLRFDGPLGSAPYVAQSPDYSLTQNPLTVQVNSNNWVFNTDGSLTLPATTSNVSVDVTTNTISMNTNDTVTFSGFSGEILVNDLYDGYMYKYLVGGAYTWLMGSTNPNWTPANTAPDNSVTVANYASIEFTSGAYIFTNLAAERSYSFYAVKTRNGA
jgi:Major tropism determinant N-terminal domain